jgi:ABC-type branched-subunit amino acid transport system substrate-binding protein
MDFYSGVLLAIYDMSKEGVSTDLNVYDVADGNLHAAADKIMNSDVVIGPVSSADIARLLEMAPDAKAIVSPLDPKAGDLVNGNDAMIQAPTPHATQYADLVSWIKEDMRPGDRCLVITEKGARQTDAVVGMTAAIDSSGIQYSPLSYSILEGRNVTESLAYLMAENATNRVYIASESEAFVNDVVRNLNLMIHKKYDVVLYAPSKIRSFETIEVENFHNSSLHVSLGYYIDYESAMVKDFLLRYRALFNTEPTQFAFQGYDIARYFITMCSKYGGRWMDKIDGETSPMLQSTFRFVKTEDGGYTNTGVRRIIYDNGWTVRKVR